MIYFVAESQMKFNLTRVLYGTSCENYMLLAFDTFSQCMIHHSLYTCVLLLLPTCVPCTVCVCVLRLSCIWGMVFYSSNTLCRCSCHYILTKLKCKPWENFLVISTLQLLMVCDRASENSGRGRSAHMFASPTLVTNAQFTAPVNG